MGDSELTGEDDWDKKAIEEAKEEQSQYLDKIEKARKDNND